WIGDVKTTLLFLIEPRPVGLVSACSALIAAAVPPAQYHPAPHEPTLVIPAPGAFIVSARLRFVRVPGPAADVVAEVVPRVGWNGEPRHRSDGAMCRRILLVGRIGPTFRGADDSGYAQDDEHHNEVWSH